MYDSYFVEQIQVFKPNKVLKGPFNTREEAEKWADKNLPRDWRKLDFLINNN